MAPPHVTPAPALRGGADPTPAPALRGGAPQDLRFVVVVGKGGVGKTSVSAALAVALARKGRRVLVAMCNARERLSHLLQVPPIGPEIRNVAPNIDAVNMEPG